MQFIPEFIDGSVTNFSSTTGKPWRWGQWLVGSDGRMRVDHGLPGNYSLIASFKLLPTRAALNALSDKQEHILYCVLADETTAGGVSTTHVWSNASNSLVQVGGMDLIRNLTTVTPGKALDASMAPLLVQDAADKVSAHNTSSSAHSDLFTAKQNRIPIGNTNVLLGPTTLGSNPNTKSLSEFVQTSGAQTIADVKTFSSIPVLPSSNPTTANQAARKAYVDLKYTLPSGGSASQYLNGLGELTTFPTTMTPSAHTHVPTDVTGGTANQFFRKSSSNVAEWATVTGTTNGLIPTLSATSSGTGNRVMVAVAAGTLAPLTGNLGNATQPIYLASGVLTAGTALGTAAYKDVSEFLGSGSGATDIAAFTNTVTATEPITTGASRTGQAHINLLFGQVRWVRENIGDIVSVASIAQDFDFNPVTNQIEITKRDNSKIYINLESLAIPANNTVPTKTDANTSILFANAANGSPGWSTAGTASGVQILYRNGVTGTPAWTATTTNRAGVLVRASNTTNPVWATIGTELGQVLTNGTSTTSAPIWTSGGTINDVLARTNANTVGWATLAAVARSGSYNDLLDTPSIPTDARLAKLPKYTTTGGATAFVITAPDLGTTFAIGDAFIVQFNVAGSGSTTLNVNNEGARALVVRDATATATWRSAGTLIRTETAYLIVRAASGTIPYWHAINVPSAGTAVGQMPTIGTALGSTANRVVCTNASGALIPIAATAIGGETTPIYVSSSGVLTAGTALGSVTYTPTAVASTAIETSTVDRTIAAHLTQIYGNITNLNTNKASLAGTNTWTGAHTFESTINSLFLQGSGIGTESIRVSNSARSTAVNYNTFFGAVLSTTNTGTYNTGFGSQVGSSLTNGSHNVFFGTRAGRLLSTGTNNVFVGSLAGDAVTTATHNVAVGNYAMQAGTGTSTGSTAVGSYALNANTSGVNTAIGYYAMAGMSSSTRNTALGFRAGQYTNTGTTQKTLNTTNSIYIGDTARSGAAVNNTTIANEIVIGTDAVGKGSRTVVIGQPTGTTGTLGTYLYGTLYVNDTEFTPTPSDLVAWVSARGTITTQPATGNTSSQGAQAHILDLYRMTNWLNANKPTMGIWSGTQAQYDAIATKNATTLYCVTDPVPEVVYSGTNDGVYTTGVTLRLKGNTVNHFRVYIGTPNALGTEITSTAVGNAGGLRSHNTTQNVTIYSRNTTPVANTHIWIFNATGPATLNMGDSNATNQNNNWARLLRSIRVA